MKFLDSIESFRGIRALTTKNRFMKKIQIAAAFFLCPALSFCQITTPSNMFVADSLLQKWNENGETLIDSFHNAISINILDNPILYTDSAANEYNIVSSTLNDFLDTLNASVTTYVRFPHGKYHLTWDQTINIPDHVVLHGDNANQTIIQLDSFQTKNHVFGFRQSQGAGLEHLTIDASHIFSSSAKDHKDFEENFTNIALIDVTRSSHCRIRGVKTLMGFGSHIMLAKSDHISIQGCYLYDAWLHGSSVGGTQGYGIAFAGNQSSNTTHCLIENNIIEECRHAIVCQYYANQNVFAYNYTLNSHAYNYFSGSQFQWGTSDVVVHGNGAGENLFEGNYFQGKSNGWYTANGITIDNVKTQDNYPRNTVYRNFTPERIRVQENGCNYNDSQLVIANSASGYNLQSTSQTIAWNLDNSGDIQTDVGSDCFGSNQVNDTSLSANLLGESAYLTEMPYWLEDYQLPVFGPESNGLLPAFDRYTDTLITEPCLYCTPASGTVTNLGEDSENELLFYPNPCGDYLMFSNQQELVGKQVFIYNLQGKLVANHKIPLNATLDISSLPKGSYQLSVPALNRHSLLVKQ